MNPEWACQVHRKPVGSGNLSLSTHSHFAVTQVKITAAVSSALSNLLHPFRVVMNCTFVVD